MRYGRRIGVLNLASHAHRSALPVQAQAGAGSGRVAVRVWAGLAYTADMMTAGTRSAMSFAEHVGELRRRLIVSGVALIAASVVAFVFRDWVFGLILKPLAAAAGEDVPLLTLSPAEPFLTVLSVSLYAGLIAALPVVLWEIWAFLMPALYESERRTILPYVLFTLLLFAGGLAFGYLIVLPVGLRFLINYGGEIFNQQLRASEYISFVGTFLLAFGVVFELPVVITVLARLGIVNARQLRRWWRYAVLVIAVLSAAITPTQDPLTMLILMVPLLLLYELAILLARVVERRRGWGRRPAQPTAEESDRAEMPCDDESER